MSVQNERAGRCSLVLRLPSHIDRRGAESAEPETPRQQDRQRSSATGGHDACSTSIADDHTTAESTADNAMRTIASGRQGATAASVSGEQRTTVNRAPAQSVAAASAAVMAPAAVAERAQQGDRCADERWREGGRRCASRQESVASPVAAAEPERSRGNSEADSVATEHMGGGTQAVNKHANDAERTRAE